MSNRRNAHIVRRHALLGGVGTTTLATCPRCGAGVAIPPGKVLGVPAKEVPGCHRIVNPDTGKVIAR